jgi:hypothetical protein
MIVTFAIAKLSEDRVRVEVQRPQHFAKAERTYSSVRDVKRVLLNVGIPEDMSDFYLKLLPDIEPNQLVRFPPLHVALHELVAEGLNPEP